MPTKIKGPICCDCGKDAGCKWGDLFTCTKCLADAIAISLYVRAASGEKNPTIQGVGQIAPEDFVETA